MLIKYYKQKMFNEAFYNIIKTFFKEGQSQLQESNLAKSGLQPPTQPLSQAGK